MGEKGNAADFGDLSTTASAGSGGGLPGGSAAKEAVSAASEAHGEAHESTAEMIGGIAAKTGGEFLAGAVLGAATEKLEDRSKRRSGSEKNAGGRRSEH